MTDAPELTCKELVELVTDYFEGALSPDERRRFEEHLGTCEGCTSYVDSMLRAMQIVGRLTEDDVPPEMERELVAAFRGWKST